MFKSHKNSPKPIHTKNFTATQLTDGSWEIRHKPDKRSGAENTHQNPQPAIGMLHYDIPDAFQCAELHLQFTQQLTPQEYLEILEPLHNLTISSDSVVFIRTRFDTLADNPSLQQALRQMHFTVDPVDPAYLFWEDTLLNWSILYGCFGLAIGTGIDMMVSGQPGTGLYLGILCGVLAGIFISTFEKKNREMLYLMREIRNADHDHHRAE